MWVNERFTRCVSIGISVHFNERWPNSSHPANKLRFDKVWKFESESVFGARWLHSRPTWGPSVVDVQDRTEVLCEVHSRANRGSVYYFSHSTFAAQTPAHTQPRKVYQTINSVILVRGFEVEKLAAIWLNTVSDAWYFLSKTDSNESRGGRKNRPHQMDSESFLSCLA